MAWLPRGEKVSKICSFVLTELTNVTDRRTPHAGIIPRLCIASRGKNAGFTFSKPETRVWTKRARVWTSGNPNCRLKSDYLLNFSVNPLECRGNYSSRSNDMRLAYWQLMGGLLHLVQGGDWAGPQPARPLLAVPNVTAHTSTVCVPITVLLYNGSLLCGFTVPIKG